MRTRAFAAALIALAVTAAPLAAAAAADAVVAATAPKSALNSVATTAAAVAAPAKKNAAQNKPATPTLFAAISARPDLSSFAAALRLIGVDDELSQSDTRTTVFAPTNAALDAFAGEVLGSSSKSSSNSASANGGKALLSERYATLLRRVAANAAGVEAPALGEGVFVTYGGQDVRLAKAAGNSGLFVATALPAARGVEAGVAADGAIDLGNNGRVYVVDRVLRPADVVVAAAPAAAANKQQLPSNSAAKAASNAANKAAAPATPPAADTLRMLLASDADVSSFARLLTLLAPELLASSATSPVTVFAPRNSAVEAYLAQKHGLASVDAVDAAVSVSLPAAAKAVESTATAATVAAASGAKSTKPSDATAAAALKAADAQKELQRLLQLRANLTAAVAFHVSPGLAVDGATLLEGGRLLPTLLAARVGHEAVVPVVAAANGVAEHEEVAAATKEATTTATTTTPTATTTTMMVAPPATKMIGARAGGNGLGSPMMLGDLGSAAVVLSSALAGDDALHKLDAVLLAAADPAAAGPSPGVAVEGASGDLAAPSADGLTTVAVPAPASAPASAGAVDAAGARGGYDISIRNQIIQNSMQANIVRALNGGMSVHQAAIYNSALANLAPYSTPYYYLMPSPAAYSGYGYGGYWMG